MLNIYIPQPLLGDHSAERLVAADLVRAGSSVRLLLARYPDFPTVTADIELSTSDGFRLKGTPVGNPVGALSFDVPDSCTDARFSVYRNGAFCGRIFAQSAPPSARVALTAATLFKGDYAQVRTWMEYHAELGFERFVLYYNGPVAAILPQLAAQSTVIEKDLLLVQWPFTYWVEECDLGAEGLAAKYGDHVDLSKATSPDWHHAQDLMLNHALTLLQDRTEFLAFFDLDEYFKLEIPMRLVDMLRASDRDVYIFQSRWAELTSSRIPALSDDSTFFDSEQIQASDWVPFPHRAKYIARPTNILGTGAHIPKAMTAGTRMVRVETDVAGIYHFHCFSGKAPRRSFVNPAAQWVTVPGLRGVNLRPGSESQA